MPNTFDTKVERIRCFLIGLAELTSEYGIVIEEGINLYEDTGKCLRPSIARDLQFDHITGKYSVLVENEKREIVGDPPGMHKANKEA